MNMKLTEKRQFKDELFEQFAHIGKALSSGRRPELVERLAQGERSVENLAAETSQSVANTSQHLQVLRQAQLVESRRQGDYIRYRLADERRCFACGLYCATWGTRGWLRSGVWLRHS